MIGRERDLSSDCPAADSDHDPDSADIFGILDYFDSDGVAYLVSLSEEYLRAGSIGVDVLDHAIRVLVRKLNGERLEGVTLRHVVLDAVLEFFSGKVLTTNTLEFIVYKRC